MASVLAVALVLISVAVGGSRIEAEGETEPSQTVVTVIGDFSIRPGYVTADLGADVTLRVVNLGTVPHNVTVTDGPRTPLLRPGEMALLHVGKLTDLKILYCSLPGHRARGLCATGTETGAGRVRAAAGVQRRRQCTGDLPLWLDR